MHALLHWTLTLIIQAHSSYWQISVHQRSSHLIFFSLHLFISYRQRLPWSLLVNVGSLEDILILIFLWIQSQYTLHYRVELCGLSILNPNKFSIPEAYLMFHPSVLGLFTSYSYTPSGLFLLLLIPSVL